MPGSILEFRFLILDLCFVNEREFKNRTKQLALRVIKLVDALPNTTTGNVIGRQLLRSATSIGANYRAACRAKSEADMIAKYRIALIDSEFLFQFFDGVSPPDWLRGLVLALYKI